MKQILFVIVLLLFVTCRTKNYTENDFIRIEHNGPSDELIKVIVISTGKISKKVEWEDNFILSEASFSSVEKLVSGQMSRINDEEKTLGNNNEWAVFKITEFISGNTEARLLTSQKASINFFEKLNDLLANEKDEASIELRNSVNIILNQIKE